MPAFMIEAPEFRGQPSVINFSDGPVDQLEDPCEQVRQHAAVLCCC
jgi:hypothetical protein